MSDIGLRARPDIEKATTTSATSVTTQPVRPRGDRSRIRAWTMSALRDVVYAGAVFVWSIVAFTILVTGVSVTASFLVLVIGVFVWIGFAYVMRWTTWVDRRLAGWQRKERVPAVYRRPPARGFVPLLKTVSSDPQTWKDLGWLGLTSTVGFALGLVVVTGAGIVLAYMSMPLWYWALSDPDDLYGLANLGLFTVDTLEEAFAATAIGLGLAPLALLVARGCATVHSGLAARVLGPPPLPESLKQHNQQRRSVAEPRHATKPQPASKER
jgi:hypothetical protein